MEGKINTIKGKGSGSAAFIRIAGYLLIVILVARSFLKSDSNMMLPLLAAAILVFILTEGIAAIISRLIDMNDKLNLLLPKETEKTN